MRENGLKPDESSIERLIIGGESFAEETRKYVAEIWNCDVYNNYGSTEGTMCGECSDISGLHVPEDLVHLDVYDPGMDKFVKDGECGRLCSYHDCCPWEQRAGTYFSIMIQRIQLLFLAGENVPVEEHI